MPVTQFYRATQSSIDSTAETTFPSTFPLSTTSGQNNIGSGSIDDATANGNGTQRIALSIFQNKKENIGDNLTTSNVFLSNEIPGAYITGIEFRIPLLFKVVATGNQAAIQGITSKISMVRYADVLDANTPLNTSVANGKKTIKSNYSGLSMISTYLGSGTATDPINYRTTIGGEGDLLGFKNHGNTPSTFDLIGLEIEYVQGSTDYQLCIAGNTHNSNNPSPAVRFYYYYPKTTITTGKLKISSGKYHIKQNSA